VVVSFGTPNCGLSELLLGPLVWPLVVEVVEAGAPCWLPVVELGGAGALDVPAGCDVVAGAVELDGVGDC
jgi:hypothetical protein